MWTRFAEKDPESNLALSFDRCCCYFLFFVDGSENSRWNGIGNFYRINPLEYGGFSSCKRFEESDRMAGLMPRRALTMSDTAREMEKP